MTSKYRVCPTCRGEGKIVNRGCSVWTADDIDQDPEGFEEMLNGTYDVVCDECGGKRVVTTTEHRDFGERRRDHFERLRESGIYPGSPDYY